MLHRADADGLVVIGQPAHAWVSGQLARAWGNARFGAVAPREAVCLGAEQHDVGWTAWEGAPAHNPRTGRPYTFMELPTGIHLGLWSAAVPSALTQSRYAALLVSLHGTGLYERHDYARDTPEEARGVRDFLARSYALQDDLLAGLRADPAYAPHATPEVIARNRRLVAVWDALSLALCMGLGGERTYPDVPAAAGAETLVLAPLDGVPTRVAVRPWPFGADAVRLVCEGRRLPETFDDDEALRAALARAPWVTIETRLEPA
ncbi:MAG TPA: DUF3891 family protein [Thermomicrobiales bacterium]|nr:DUF3891 family protein [Thermomicrobiales bacterium]